MALNDWVLRGKPWEEWGNPLALYTYDILGKEFGWDVVTEVLKEYIPIEGTLVNESDDVRLDIWAHFYVTKLQKNLCPYFEWWGWQLSEETLITCESLPAFDETKLLGDFIRKECIKACMLLLLY